MSEATIEATFALGQIVITPNARDSIPEIEVLKALRRHAAGDWGEMSPEDIEANDKALEHGGRILSAYCSESCEKFWIITEADRSSTCVLMPEDY